MSTIVTRAGKGSALTFTEVDANFTNLNNGKLEVTGGNISGNLFFTGQSTGDQLIRIGSGRTSNGYSYLDLQGDATYSDGLRLIRTNIGVNSTSSLIHRGTGPLVLQTTEAGPIAFVLTNLERIRIDASGNVGIGTTAPKSRLQSSAGTSLNAPVLGSATNAPFYYSNNDAAYGVLFGNSAADGHGWIQAQRTDGTALAYNLTLNEAGGSVGVGTTTPEYKLHVANGYTGIGALNTTALAPSSAVGVAAFSWNRSSGGGETNIANTFNAATSSFEFLQKTGASTANVLYQMSSTSHILYTANTERMRIDNSGNVGIGTSAPTGVGSYPTLDIKGTSGGALRVGTATIQSVIYTDTSGMNVYTATSTPIVFSIAAVEKGRFDTSGNFIITGAGGLGYGTGSGGAVTQLTSRTTGVTLNKTNGAITMFSAAGNASPQTFVVTNSTVAATDVVHVSVRSSSNVYFVAVTSTSAGAFAICVYSLVGSAVDAPVINFAVIKAVTA